jgi:hypothetical protein
MPAWCRGFCARFHVDLGILLSSYCFHNNKENLLWKRSCLSMESGSLEGTVNSLEWRNDQNSSL